MTVTYSLVGWFGNHRKESGVMSWDAALLLGENWARSGADVEVRNRGSVVLRLRAVRDDS